MIGNFLVSPEMQAYLIRFEGTATLCTQIPSMAQHYIYRVADRLAYFLRSRGFEEAHVCSLDGMPATPQSIADGQMDSFAVTFGTDFYFAGLDRSGCPQGTKDTGAAQSVSRQVAEEVKTRLKRMGFKDAEVIEFSDAAADVEEELKALQYFSPDPESITFSKS